MSDTRQTIATGLLLPAGQAILTGVLVAAAAVSAWKLSQGVSAWRLFAAALAGGALVAWLVVWRKWRDWGDVERGITPAQPEVIYSAEATTLNIQWQGGGDYLTFGVQPDLFAEWCVGVWRGRSLGENHWTGRAGIFSKGEYHAMRDELEKCGLIRQRLAYHAGGYELTGKGRAVVGEVARRATMTPARPDRITPFRSNNAVSLADYTSRASERVRERKEVTRRN